MKKIWLLKVFGICLCVCIGLFLFTPYLQAATPTYIQLEFSDIDYDEAQYIKFIIDADEDFDIFLYMKDNDDNTFYVIYQTENNEYTGDFDKDDNDELIIYLDEDNYVTGHDETFDSFDHSNGIMSFDKYINTQWEEQEYDGGSAELEKIRIYGNEFKLYYIAIDDGDFDDPTWEFNADEYGPKGGSMDFKYDGHTYSTTTDIIFGLDCIHISRDTVAAAGVGYEGLQYPGGFYGGYTGYGYPPWTYYGGNTEYLPPGGTYGPGYNPLSSRPSGISNMVASSNWNTSQMGIELSRPYYYSPSDWNQQYNYSGSPNYYPDRYAVPVNPQNLYGAYTILPTSYSGYYGNPYNPNNPLYGTVPRPNLSLPSEIMNMLLSSNYETSQRGYELSLPYFQADMMSGWTPWSSPYGPQTYNSYGGNPWGY